ncbi:MAG: cytochrome c maturation protein CcmE [Sutterella wadsworthensis]
MDSKTKKLALIGAAVVAVGAGVTLALQAFNENLVFFFSPTQVAAKEAPTGRTFRLGGVVEPGSVKRQADGVTVTFGITDTAKIVPVQYKGILPDLFAEGQGVVAQGKLDEQGVFCASEVLAKHDENYMPPEAAKASRRRAQGRRSQGSRSGHGPKQPRRGGQTKLLMPANHPVN